jgi:hypothetical protein
MINLAEEAGEAKAAAPTGNGELPKAGGPSFTLRPATGTDGRLEAEMLEVSMGPQHPSTHGVFRMDVVLDGERVVRLKPVFGYLHRNHEKIAEGTTYLASMPYTTGWITSVR